MKIILPAYLVLAGVVVGALLFEWAYMRCDTGLAVITGMRLRAEYVSFVEAPTGHTAIASTPVAVRHAEACVITARLGSLPLLAEVPASLCLETRVGKAVHAYVFRGGISGFVWESGFTEPEKTMEEKSAWQ